MFLICFKMPPPNFHHSPRFPPISSFSFVTIKRDLPRGAGTKTPRNTELLNGKGSEAEWLKRGME